MTFFVYEEFFFSKSRAIFLWVFWLLDRKYTCRLICFHWFIAILAFPISRLSLFPLLHPCSLGKQIALLSESCFLHWQLWWQVNPPWQACWGKEHKKCIFYRDVFASLALSLYTAKLKSLYGMKKDLVALVGDSFTGVYNLTDKLRVCCRQSSGWALVCAVWGIRLATVCDHRECKPRQSHCSCLSVA